MNKYFGNRRKENILFNRKKLPTEPANLMHITVTELTDGIMLGKTEIPNVA